MQGKQFSIAPCPIARSMATSDPPDEVMDMTQDRRAQNHGEG